ncbi:MAG: AAA family ATPase [Candidatus Saccharimonadales bacterium]
MTFAPDLVLHDITRRRCEAFVADPHNGLLLYGSFGCGLLTLAQAIARALSNEPGAMMVVQGSEGKDIAIEQIRQLYHDTRAKRSGRLTVIIDDAERMSVPAQNSFLKLLEEPPENVVFIVATHSPQLLLPTIRSRIAAIEVRPISRSVSLSMIEEHGINDAMTQSQLLFLAGGRPAGLMKLLDDPDYFSVRADVTRQARSVLQASTYQRLIGMKVAMGDRATALELVTTMGNIISYGIAKQPSDRSAHQLDIIASTIDQLQSNANVRLQLLHLALAL